MHGRVDIQVGTLSKAIGALGGYVAGNKNLIEFLYHRARPFLFSTSHPPSVVMACMLRRLIGDDAFFAGLRDFYATWRYKKAGTGDFRAAMEKASGRPLDRFFERWIFGSGIPTLHFSYVTEGQSVRVRFEQKGDVYDVPVLVTLTYADGTTDDVVVAATEAVTERTLPLKGTLRGVEVNRDNGALAEIEK